MKEKFATIRCFGGILMAVFLRAFDNISEGIVTKGR